MQALQRSFKVSTAYGGGFVESIDGHSGSKSNEVDWFYYVNGIQAAKGAASTQLHKGDHVWWDRHDYSATDSIPAVVGSFPEPFTNGVGGQRYPTIVECVDGKSTPCQTVTKELVVVQDPGLARRRRLRLGQRLDRGRRRPVEADRRRARGRAGQVRPGRQRRLRAVRR